MDVLILVFSCLRIDRIALVAEELGWDASTSAEWRHALKLATYSHKVGTGGESRGRELELGAVDLPDALVVVAQLFDAPNLAGLASVGSTSLRPLV